MNMKRNLIILGVAVVLVVGFVVAMTQMKPSTSPTASPTATDDPTLKLVNKSADDVVDVTVQNAKGTYTLTKNGDKYVIKGQESLSLDQTQAGDLFGSAAIVTARRLIEQSPKDLSIYGLDKPQATVTANYKNGTSKVFLVGGENPAGDSYYFMMQGDPRVVTVYTGFGDSFLSSSDALLTKEALTVTKDGLDYVKVLKDGNPVLEMTSKGTNSVSISSWMIKVPWERAVDSQQLDTYLTSVTGVTMDSVVDGNPKDLSQYGLDKPAYDVTISGTVNSKELTNELLIGKQKDDTYTYVKFGDSPFVYQASTSSLSFTGTSAYMLMDKMIILVNIPSVTGVEFAGLSQQGTMDVVQTPEKDDNGQAKKDGNGNPMYDQTFSINGKAIADDVARYYYQICIGLQTHSLIPEGTVPSSDTQPVATLTYHRNADPTLIKIEFLPYNEDFYAVRMNGETDFLIAKENVQTVADSLAKLEAGTLTVPKS